MQKALALSLAAIVGMSTAVPAYADAYVYYGNSGRHHGKHHGKHHHNHHNKWKSYHSSYYSPRVRHVYVQQPYVQRTYYNEPATYSSVRCTNSYNPLGLLLGGAAGGVLGHQIGKGKGKTVATIGGAVLGSAIGSSVLQQNCTEQVFQEVPVGMPVTWQASDSYYSVTPTRDFRTAGRYCREYQAISTVAGRQQQTYGTACMQPDGSWEVVN